MKVSARRTFVIVVLSFFVLFASARLAGASDLTGCKKQLEESRASGVLEKLELRYGRISTLRARFVQKSYFIGMDETLSSEGRLIFSKPGRMDWSYEKPERQRFVTNGDTFWFHQPELNQVTVGDFRRAFSSDLPLSFLMGVSTLSDSFSLRRACELDGEILFEFRPKKGAADLRSFSLGVRMSDYLPISAVVEDGGGNQTSILLSGLRVNESVSVGRFDFVIPRGVDVIDERSNRSEGGTSD